VAEGKISDEIEAALGKRPLTTLIKDVDLLNVFTGEIYPASIGIYRNKIVTVGKGAGELRSDLIIDGTGKTAIPGLIDTHLHIESSMITPANFAAAVLPHGTTTVVADPHEIGNVLGKNGVRMMLDNSKGLPLSILLRSYVCA
jgi:adenine deaminase